MENCVCEKYMRPRRFDCDDNIFKNIFKCLIYPRGKFCMAIPYN